MKKGMNLQELATELTRQKDEKLDYVIDNAQVAMDVVTETREVRNDHGETVEQTIEVPKIVIPQVNDDPISTGFTDHAGGQIATFTGIGTRYFRKMQEDSPDLLATNVNHWLQRNGEKRRMWRTLDGQCRAFLSDRYLRLDNDIVAQLALEVLLEAKGEGMEVDFRSLNVTPRNLYIKAIFPQTEKAVKVGDPVQFGVIITNSEIGGGSLKIRPFVERLVCTNGMTSNRYEQGVVRRHLGSKIAEDGVVYRQETIELAAQATLAQCRDAITTFSQREFYDNILNDMRQAAESTQIEHPRAGAEVLSNTLGLSQNEADNVLINLIQDGDFSRWGALNAVTKIANECEDYDRASELEELGGKVLHFGKRDWDRIAQAEPKRQKVAA